MIVERHTRWQRTTNPDRPWKHTYRNGMRIVARTDNTIDARLVYTKTVWDSPLPFYRLRLRIAEWRARRAA